MISRFARILFLIAACKLAAVQSMCQANLHNVSLEKYLGGKEALSTIATPESVEATLLNSARRERSSPVAVSSSISKAFSAALSDEKSHHRVNMTHCSPDYGMRLRFKRGSDMVTVDFCFQCKILRITDGRSAIEESFDFEKNDFTKLAKELFPNDKTIQELR